MSRIAAVEVRVPARNRRDERRRRQQGAVGLSGRDVVAGRGAGKIGKVEDVGREGAVWGGGDGGELVGVEGGGDVGADFEELGAAAVVDVEGGEDYVDGLGFPERWV